MVNDNTRKTPSADTTVLAYRAGDFKKFLRALFVAVLLGLIIGGVMLVQEWQSW